MQGCRQKQQQINPAKGFFAAHCCPCLPDGLCSFCRRLQDFGGCGTVCPSQAGPVLWDVRSPACCLPAAALAAGAGAGCRCQE